MNFYHVKASFNRLYKLLRPLRIGGVDDAVGRRWVVRIQLPHMLDHHCAVHVGHRVVTQDQVYLHVVLDRLLHDLECLQSIDCFENAFFVKWNKLYLNGNDI